MDCEHCSYFLTNFFLLEVESKGVGQNWGVLTLVGQNWGVLTLVGQNWGV